MPGLEAQHHRGHVRRRRLGDLGRHGGGENRGAPTPYHLNAYTYTDPTFNPDFVIAPTAHRPNWAMRSGRNRRSIVMIAAWRQELRGPPMLAYDYPLLGVFWTMMFFFLWASWLFAAIWAFIDNFRRQDHSGLAKAAWAIFIILVPLLGVFALVLFAYLAAVYLTLEARDPEELAAFRGRALMSGIAVGLLAGTVLVLAAPEVRRGLIATSWAFPRRSRTGVLCPGPGTPWPRTRRLRPTRGPAAPPGSDLGAACAWTLPRSRDRAAAGPRAARRAQGCRPGHRDWVARSRVGRSRVADSRAPDSRAEVRTAGGRPARTRMPARRAVREQFAAEATCDRLVLPAATRE